MDDKPLGPVKKPMSDAFAVSELGSDFDEQFFILNFGTRLLTAFTDKNILIDIALETLADFSQGKQVAILSLDENNERLDVEGVFSDARSSRPSVSFPFAGTALEKLLLQKVVVVSPLALEKGVPLPAQSKRAGTDQCLCLPLVGASFRVVGLATIAVSENHQFTFIETQQLRILSTMLAVSLENARLFARVISDSLTHLYTRRFYEIRVEEELAKLKRNNGVLAVILFDLDDFKNVNDSFGHLTGDDVLRQFAALMQESVRKGSTIVSRYGGEEFILLLPDAGLDQAFALANRIKTQCADHSFGDDKREISITVSGGVASADHTQSLSPKELFHRADTALYQAKQQGRNRVVAWKE